MLFSLICVLLVTIAADEAHAVELTPVVLAGAWVLMTIYALRLILRGAWQQWSPHRRVIAEALFAVYRKRGVPAPILLRIANDAPRSRHTTLSA